MNETSPYLFVVGCPRSGTTLLQRMLDSHPWLAVANDTHFITRVLDKVDPRSAARAIDGNPVPLTPELVDGVLGYSRFRRLGVGDDDVRVAAAGATCYSGLVGALYRRFAATAGKKVGGEKTPDYVKRLDLLHALFPTSRVVHIVRDGRDVALSVLDWAAGGKGPGKMALWQTEPVAVCALWWSWQVGLGRSSGWRIGPSGYTEVPYEKLVAAPELELRRIATFLELPYVDEMAAFHRGRTRKDPGLSAKSAWLPATAGLRDWRSQMSPRDVELFEALAGDRLVELGYERSVRQFSPRIREVAAFCSEWWTAMLSRRERKAQRRAARLVPSASPEVAPWLQ